MTVSVILTISLAVGVPATTLQHGLVKRTANMAFALIHCDAEADTEEEYQACKDCFDLINDYNSEEGLGDAKDCIEQHLPIAQVDIKRVINYHFIAIFTERLQFRTISSSTRQYCIFYSSSVLLSSFSAEVSSKRLSEHQL